MKRKNNSLKIIELHITIIEHPLPLESEEASSLAVNTH